MFTDSDNNVKFNFKAFDTSENASLFIAFRNGVVGDFSGVPGVGSTSVVVSVDAILLNPYQMHNLFRNINDKVELSEMPGII